MALSQETERDGKGGQLAAEALTGCSQRPCASWRFDDDDHCGTEVPLCASRRSRVNHHHAATILSGTSTGPTSSGRPLARVSVKGPGGCICGEWWLDQINTGFIPKSRRALQ